MSETTGAKNKIPVVRPMGRMMGPPETTRMHQKVKNHIARGNPWIVIDLGNVDWFNSKGIGSLVSCLMSCRDADGDLVVARPGKKVLSVFMVSQVVKLFDTYETVKEAKEAVLEQRSQKVG